MEKRARQQMAVPVLVLQAFAFQRRPPGGGSQEKAAGPHVGGSPDQIADTLKSEHRVEDIEGNRVERVRRVGRPGGDERRQRARFGDAFFQNLAVGRFEIIEQRTLVDRLIELADVGINPILPEERLEAEGPGFVGNDRHEMLRSLSDRASVPACGQIPSSSRPRGRRSLR